MTTAPDARRLALSGWAARLLGDRYDTIEPASADASFRRYFRVRLTTGETYIAMDAPPDKEDSRPYINIARRLRALGLNVPEILAQDLDQGFLLITDLGNQSYLQALSADTVERLYGDALGALVVLQAGIYTDSAFLPPYDANLLRREAELFREWYLGRHLGVALSVTQHETLDRSFEALVQAAVAQPQVWVHRDYHSRNLMVTYPHNPGILDFQDAVRGPVTYDLVSLLRDCYIAWPRSRVEEWAKGYYALAGKSGLPVGEDDGEFLRWFDWMGVQRHLKAIGIFARLCHRDDKPGYLKDIPRTLGYVIDVCGRHPPLASLHELLGELRVTDKACLPPAP